MYIDSSKHSALKDFILKLKLITDSIRSYSDIVFVCIGSDRSTGDSLGPLIGYKIQNIERSDIHVYGTLENPVHAKNICGVARSIKEKYEMPFIIAIDASLGKIEHVGYITVGKGALKPGSALDKDLPPIGNIHITGIVNFSGFMDFMTLQNTRLYTVMKMVDIISEGLHEFINGIEMDHKTSLVSILDGR
jgi:putative sporulation protein YyaC